jgi:hypothetical protein
LHSKFVKTNELSFKTNLLKVFSSIDLKFYLCSNPLQSRTIIQLFTTWLTWNPNIGIHFNQNFMRVSLTILIESKIFWLQNSKLRFLMERFPKLIFLMVVFLVLPDDKVCIFLFSWEFCHSRVLLTFLSDYRVEFLNAS